jgi:major membrane immunogen (membrane-anchored lipoprotein)
LHAKTTDDTLFAKLNLLNKQTGGTCMKKQWLVGAIVMVFPILLAGCTSDQSKSSESSTSVSSTAMSSSAAMSSSGTRSTEVVYKDGDYKVEAKDFDDNGWKEYVEVTVANGKITKVNYNAVNKDNQLKTDDEEYKTNMEKSQGTYPEKYTKDLADQLVDHQKVSEVDAVTGATHSSDNFKKLATAALTQAEEGKTGTETIALA